MNENTKDTVFHTEITPSTDADEVKKADETPAEDADNVGADVPDEEGDAIPAEEESAEEDAPATEDGAAEIDAVEEGEETVALTDAEKRRILANPMFLTFASGKAQGLDELISDFHKMISLGGDVPKVSARSRATPSPSAASPDYALSERQRRIARDAGMSYREYYGFLKNMKTK
ncbi:MAG: hypothetical protein J5860_01780 [Clostridia bacterium]|nr:hypothetical protein [Clostridia bacterium]